MGNDELFVSTNGTSGWPSSVSSMYILGDSSVDCGDNTPFYPILHQNLSLNPCNGSDQTLLPQLLGTYSLSLSVSLLLPFFIYLVYVLLLLCDSFWYLCSYGDEKFKKCLNFQCFLFWFFIVCLCVCGGGGVGVVVGVGGARGFIWRKITLVKITFFYVESHWFLCVFMKILAPLLSWNEGGSLTIISLNVYV